MEGRGSGSMLRLVVVGVRGRGRLSAKCIESSDRFGLQGRRRTRGVPAGCACNLSSEDRLWALKPALACCVPLHGTYPCWIKPVRRHLCLVLSSFSLHRVGAAVAPGGKRYGVAAGCRRRAVCSTVGGQPRVLQAAVETECLVGSTGVVYCWPGQLIDGARAPRNHTKLGTGMASSIRLCVTVAAVVGTHARCALLEVVGCWWATKGGPLA